MDTLPKIQVWKPVVIFLLIGLFFIWLLNTFNSRNALWFVPIQPSFAPERLVLRNYGETVELYPGDPGFAELAAAVDQSLSRFHNRALIDIGLGDKTLQEYQTNALVLEVYYPEPVRFNLPIRMEKISQLLFPIDGRHAGSNYAFIGHNGVWLVGALQTATDEPIRQALRDLGYLKDGS